MGSTRKPERGPDSVCSTCILVTPNPSTSVAQNQPHYNRCTGVLMGKVADGETCPWFSLFKWTLPTSPYSSSGVSIKYCQCIWNCFKMLFGEPSQFSLQALSGPPSKKKWIGTLSGLRPSQALPAWECVVSVFDSLMAKAPGFCSSVNTTKYLQCWLGSQA